MFREATMMARCKHVNVVVFYGVQCDIPPVMIVMEYCPGGSLEDHLLKQKERICLGERLQFCMEAANGIRYLHKQRLIHRYVYMFILIILKANF